MSDYQRGIERAADKGMPVYSTEAGAIKVAKRQVDAFLAEQPEIEVCTVHGGTYCDDRVYTCEKARAHDKCEWTTGRLVVTP